MFTIKLPTLLTAVILFNSYQLSRQENPDPCDTYTNCVFQHTPTARTSGTEVILVLLQLSNTPTDLAERCEALRDQFIECQESHDACPALLHPTRTTIKPYAERFYDPVYVSFIMSLGNHGCQKCNIPLILELKNCTNTQFVESLREFINKDNYNERDLTNIFKTQAPAACSQYSLYFLKDVISRFLSRKPKF
uniref:Saposin B-type domain-containing protein n=1 Tax=Arion vulgaris TaxID=1028688 RepID=A0A0B6YSZ8_9EUPU